MIDAFYFYSLLVLLVIWCVIGGYCIGYSRGSKQTEKIYLVINGEEHEVK